MNKQGQGFVTFAQNTSEVDYLKLAYLQALNIKCLHPQAQYAVIVDETTKEYFEQQSWEPVFDQVILLPQDNAARDEWKLANEYQIFQLTPFKETIKLESDLLFNRSIKHWWPALRLKNIVLSYNCKTYRQQISTEMMYRQLFVDNDLPNVYNGMMYFRYSSEAAEFFNIAEQIYNSWEIVKKNLRNIRDEPLDTDLMYALTAKIFGVEQCTVPSLDFWNFVHMKPGINGWGYSDYSWQDMVLGQREQDMIRIHNLNQYYPVHYYDKKYCTDELVNEYEQRFRTRSQLA